MVYLARACSGKSIYSSVITLCTVWETYNLCVCVSVTSGVCLCVFDYAALLFLSLRLCEFACLLVCVCVCYVFVSPALPDYSLFPGAGRDLSIFSVTSVSTEAARCTLSTLQQCVGVCVCVCGCVCVCVCMKRLAACSRDFKSVCVIKDLAVCE